MIFAITSFWKWKINFIECKWTTQVSWSLFMQSYTPLLLLYINFKNVKGTKFSLFNIVGFCPTKRNYKYQIKQTNKMSEVDTSWNYSNK